MTYYPQYLALALALVGGRAARVNCICPAADPGPLLMTTGRPSAPAFVVCGYEDGRHAGILRASEFRIYGCQSHTQVFEFDATQTADLVSVGDDLQITKVSMWPTGPEGQMRYVPIARLLLQVHDPDTLAWHPLLTRPRMSSARILQIVVKQEKALAEYPNDRPIDDEDVAWLFVASLAGDSAARSLFCSVRWHAHLDGPAEEAYDDANDDLARGAPASITRNTCEVAFQSVPVAGNGRVAAP